LKDREQALSGPWRGLKDDAGQKLLLFSRFRATPGAVASLMSLSAENVRDKRQPRLRASGAVYSMFYPSPLLIGHFDPQFYVGQGFDAVRAGAQRSLRNLLRDLKIGIVNRTQKERRRRRNIWKLLLSLEAQYDSAFRPDRCRPWREITEDALPRFTHVESISRRELRALAELAVEVPGVVCGRAFSRYQRNTETRGQQLGILPEQDLAELSWKALRTYLDDPVFLKKTAKRGAIEQTRDLVRDGCLEAVLDEHIWHAAKKPKATLKGIAVELCDALQLSPGASGFHVARRRGSGPPEKDGFRIACRAAVAFGSTERLDGGKAVRPDEVRKAFNSPFRPFLLASTSVGQEGLDFHVWCDRIVHWDLCSTPLDLEQREGRIQRFLGLGVRRALARTHGSKISGIQPGSPWNFWKRRPNVLLMEQQTESSRGGWFNLSDPGAEDALYESPVLRGFAGVDLGRAAVPDETTILNFRHLLEQHELNGKILDTVNLYLAGQGIGISTGTIVDATIISAPSSTKNSNKERDPEMHQTRKGNQYYFGAKAHIGVDSKEVIGHSVCTSAASVHDKHMLPDLLHGEEKKMWGDAGYQGQTATICAAHRRLRT
jgi:IS5 family transposase